MNEEEIQKDNILLSSFLIGLIFTFASGIVVGLASGFITYHCAKHGKTLPKSEIYGILTGVFGSIIMIIIVITVSLF